MRAPRALPGGHPDRARRRRCGPPGCGRCPNGATRGRSPPSGSAASHRPPSRRHSPQARRRLHRARPTRCGPCAAGRPPPGWHSRHRSPSPCAPSPPPARHATGRAAGRPRGMRGCRHLRHPGHVRTAHRYASRAGRAWPSGRARFPLHRKGGYTRAAAMPGRGARHRRGRPRLRPTPPAPPRAGRRPTRSTGPLRQRCPHARIGRRTSPARRPR